MSYQGIADFIVIKLARELLNQGHQHTGALINSLKGNVTKLTNGIEISVTSNKTYWRIVNDGVKPNRIPYRGRSGRGGKSAYIQALIAYFKKKGVADPKSAAFATATKQRKEGMPTKGSHRYSSTGKRTNFIEETLKRHGQNIEDQAFDVGFELLKVKIDKVFDRLDAV